jgi:hypothetical protein
MQAKPLYMHVQRGNMQAKPLYMHVERGNIQAKPLYMHVVRGNMQAKPLCKQEKWSKIASPPGNNAKNPANR